MSIAEAGIMSTQAVENGEEYQTMTLSLQSGDTINQVELRYTEADKFSPEAIAQASKLLAFQTGIV